MSTAVETKKVHPIFGQRYETFIGSILQTFAKYKQDYYIQTAQLQAPFTVLVHAMTEEQAYQFESIHRIDGVGFTLYVYRLREATDKPYRVERHGRHTD